MWGERISSYHAYDPVTLQTSSGNQLLAEGFKNVRRPPYRVYKLFPLGKTSTAATVVTVRCNTITCVQPRPATPSPSSKTPPTPP